MTAASPEPSRAVDRVGHLSEMAFDRLKLDAPESDPAFFEAAQAHLAACDGCRAAFAAMASEDDGFGLPPSAVVRARARPPASTARRALLGRLALSAGGALALAAGLLVFARPPARELPIGGLTLDPPETLVARGGALDLEVHVHDGRASRLVDDGGVVHPGERAGFGLRAGAAGWVLVFGWDATGAPYAAYPAGEAAVVRAAAIEAGREVAAVSGAVRFDELLGDEHLAALWCGHAFGLTDVAPSGVVDLPALARRLAAAPAAGPVGSATADLAGCALRHVVVHKRPR